MMSIINFQLNEQKNLEGVGFSQNGFFPPKVHGSAVICGEVYHRILTHLLEMVSACVSHGSAVEGPSNAADEVSVP